MSDVEVSRRVRVVGERQGWMGSDLRSMLAELLTHCGLSSEDIPGVLRIDQHPKNRMDKLTEGGR
jgi:hypothetical protein